MKDITRLKSVSLNREVIFNLAVFWMVIRKIFEESSLLFLPADIFIAWSDGFLL